MWRPVSNNELLINFYYWGPFLTKFKIEESERLKLLDVSKKSDEDFRHELAGIIKNEKKFNQKNTDWFYKTFLKYFDAYLAAFKKHTSQEILENYTTVEKESVWVNFMKANEFNPPHIHSGDLSFVIYLDIPKNLNKERYEYKGTSAGPGAIVFNYGESNPSGSCQHFITSHMFLPEKGDFFIFPANLRHYVIPFKSKGERISVSGNLNFK